MLRSAGSLLVGREAEVAVLVESLGPGVTTLTGPGGVGKTLLALGAIEAVRPRFGDVWVCELAGVTAADSVGDAIADTLGAFRNHDVSALDAVASALHGRRALLVLDNVEQVIGGAGRFVSGLIERCPELSMLVTSREALRIASEVVVEVAPLDVERHAPLLLRQRARSPTSLIDLAAEREHVVAICRHLDGLPLAVELVAARLATMTIHEVRERLDRCFGLLPDTAVHDHHATLARVIEWTHDLLELQDRRLFDCLSVFRGGFDIGSAASLARRVGDAEFDVGAALDSLVDASMLMRIETSAGSRWEMLEPLRHFGDRQLSERGERSTIRNAHLDRILTVASEAGEACSGDSWSGGVARFRAEWDNLRSAIDWAIGTQRARDVDRLLGHVLVIARWTLDSEPSVWAARAIQRGLVTDVPVGAPAHLIVALGEFRAGLHEAALCSNLTALEVTSTESDRRWAHHFAALEMLYLGRTAEAASMVEFAVTEPADRPAERAMQQSAHAVLKLLGGQMAVPDADRAVAAATELARSTGHPIAEGHAAYNSGMVASLTGRPVEAAAAFAIAMSLGRTFDVPNLISDVLSAQVYTPGPTGLRAACDALDWWRDHRDVGNEYVVIEATGINFVEAGRIENGAMLLGHLGSEARRISPTVGRRDAAIEKVQASRKGRAAFARGAGALRPQLLEYARAAVDTALAR